MGTSAERVTPSGGDWTAIKREITREIHGTNSTNPNRIIGGVIGATRGFSGLGGRGSGGSGGRGNMGGGGGVGGGRGRSGVGKSAIGKAVGGLGGFGAALDSGGLDQAIESLGLAELRGKPASEIISRIAEHLADGTDGIEHELMTTALRDAILECAALTGDGSYNALDSSLQTFLEREGIGGLVESFLSHFVFDGVWSLLENHVNLTSNGVSDSQALASAVENACRMHVQELIAEVTREGRFERVDWFGTEGSKLGGDIVATLEFRLQSLALENNL